MHTALTLVKFENVVFTDDEGYMGESEAKEKGLKPKKLSGTEFRRLMRVSSRTSSPRSAQPHADKLCWVPLCGYTITAVSPSLTECAVHFL
jgi:hypothetical protein